jgi:3-oxoacyl-[acyl-carrier protein] reductase
MFAGQMTVDFTGRTVVVTGAGAGIGEAIAMAFARAGANVVANDMNPDRVERIAEAIKAAGGQAIAFQGDIANRFQAAALIETARDAYSRVNIFVNAAGIYKAEAIGRIDEWDWRRQIEVNLTGAFFCTQLMGRVMSDEGGGIIVHLASTAGYTHTLPQGAGYVASKAGLIALTQQAARELAPVDVRVNAVCVGSITEPDMPPEPHNMLNRMGDPLDVANAVMFLCSEGARFITGQTLVVDGGGLGI